MPRVDTRHNLTYPQSFILNVGERYRQDDTISTARAESTVREAVGKQSAPGLLYAQQYVSRMEGGSHGKFPQTFD